MRDEEIAMGRIEPHSFEVVGDGEVEVLSEASLKGAYPDAGLATQILGADRFMVVHLDEILSSLGDAPSTLADGGTLGLPIVEGMTHIRNRGGNHVGDFFQIGIPALAAQALGGSHFAAYPTEPRSPRPR